MLSKLVKRQVGSLSSTTDSKPFCLVSDTLRHAAPVSHNCGLKLCAAIGCRRCNSARHMADTLSVAAAQMTATR